MILLFFFETNFENFLISRAGALRFAFICASQLFDVKSVILSFSNNDALFIKQSKFFNFFLQN